jgi:hypothetical protein
LIDYNIKPGAYTCANNNSNDDDDWPAILEKILASQIVIFATPVWWGNLVLCGPFLWPSLRQITMGKVQPLE